MKFLRFLRALTTDRRIILGLGAALLVGGWGMTRLAHERLTHWPISRDGLPLRMTAWLVAESEDDDHYWRSGFFVTPRTLYMIGVVGMAAGAGLMGFAVLRKSE